MKKKILIGALSAFAGLVIIAVVLGLLFLNGFFLPKEGKAYNRAVSALKKPSAVTLDVKQTTTTRLDDGSMTLAVEQVLTYAGQDTKSPFVHLKESFPGVSDNGIHEEYLKGKTLYVNQKFQGTLTKKAAQNRYAPVGLLSPMRYKKITSETTDGITVIQFASPRRGEEWAVPSGTSLVTASGSASLDQDGNLLQTQYTVTYRQGNCEVTVDTVSTPRKEAIAVSLPTDTDRYQTLTYIDAPRVVAYGNARLMGLPSAEAAMAEYTLQMNGNAMHTSGNSVKSSSITLCRQNEKLQYEIYGTSASNVSSATQQITTYKDGNYTVTTISRNKPNGNTKTFQYTEEQARKSLCDSLYLQTPDPAYWEDVTVSDVKGITFLEFTYTDQFSEELHDASCISFSGNLDYEVTESSGYVALDQTTGLVTASGYRNVWRHKSSDPKTYITQKDMTLTAPSLGAYQTLVGELPSEKEPEKKATPLLYRVTGKDGQEMWLMGTIHVGDARTGYLPDEVYAALKNADALALEMDQEKFQKQLDEDPDMAQRINDLYIASSGKPKDVLAKRDYELALKLIKASGNYTPNIDDMKMAAWENIIINFYLQLGHNLHSEKGVEMRLTELAKDQNKPIWEVESGLSQMELLLGWSPDLQEMMLTSTLSTDWNLYCQQTSQLYELWCTGDEAALRKSINQEEKSLLRFLIPRAQREKMESLMAEYDQAMNTDRNKKMVKTAISYLESEKTVFFAVGLAHLLDDADGLVDSLRQAGYTVEPVTYS